jgi:hypothetical protein
MHKAAQPSHVVPPVVADVLRCVAGAKHKAQKVDSLLCVPLLTSSGVLNAGAKHKAKEVDSLLCVPLLTSSGVLNAARWKVKARLLFGFQLTDLECVGCCQLPAHE